MGRGRAVAPSASGPGPAFPGFPAGALVTAVPNAFFTAVLPQIQRPEELIVSLYFFFAQGRPFDSAQGRRRRTPCYLSERELAADATLLRSLAGFCDDPEGALRHGLALAVERGTLLRTTVALDGQPENLYLLNTPTNRKATTRLQQRPCLEEKPLPPAAVSTKPNIFALYEENIGSITPLIAEELKDAEARYPPPWVEAAFREAVSLNKRSWRYIKAILERWEAEGPDYETPRRDPEADWLEQRYRAYLAGKRRRPYRR